jgi:ABC-2 type transport system permease protein
LISFISLFGWYELMNSIHSGEISSDLLKPLNLFNIWLARDAGRAAVAFLLRGVSIVLLYDLFFPVQHPQSWQQWTAVALALPLAWLVSFAYRFLVNAAAFWSPNAKGIGRMGFVVAMFFSGFPDAPLLFPHWVQNVALLTPFPYMLNGVVEFTSAFCPARLFWQAIGVVIRSGSCCSSSSPSCSCEPACAGW